MKKITRITLHYDNGTEYEVPRDTAKWLFVATDITRWRQISLSGDDVNNAYLLRVLENAVVQEMNKYNQYNKEVTPNGTIP